MNTFNRARRGCGLIMLALGLTAAIGSLETEAASAQADGKAVRTDKQVYVAGVDRGIVFEGKLPTCVNADVTLAAYRFGPARQMNERLGEPRPVQVRVGPDGQVVGSVLLDAAVVKPATVWAAVSGECLDKPEFTDATIHLAVYDPVGNPSGSAAIFIPSWVLATSATIGEGKTLAESVGTLSVFADGVLCTKASLVSDSVVDGEGNGRIRVGGPSQAAQCGRPGALLTFSRGDGELLVERRTLIPGVTQPLANLAPAAPGTGSQLDAPGPGSVPGAPQTGTGVPRAAVPAVSESREFRPWRLVALAMGVVAAVGATWTVARRR